MNDFSAGAAAPLACFLLGYPDLTTIATVINPTRTLGRAPRRFPRKTTLRFRSPSPSITACAGNTILASMTTDNNMVNFDPYYQNICERQEYWRGHPDQTTDLPRTSIQDLCNPSPQLPSSWRHRPGSANRLRDSLQSGFRTPRRLRLACFQQQQDGSPRRIRTIHRIAVERHGHRRWSVGASDVANFSNSIGQRGPGLQSALFLPLQHRATRHTVLRLAAEVHYKDPIVEEWNLTLEQDLGQRSRAARFLRRKPWLQHSDLTSMRTSLPSTLLGFSDPALRPRFRFP